MGQLNGKIAWVTGAGTGIGESAALKLAEEGATVILTGRRKEPLEAVAAKIQAKGGTAAIEPADLTDASAVEAAVKHIVAKFARIDLLVSNAGVNIIERGWSKISIKGIDDLIHGNLSAAFYCVHAVLPIMRAQGGGQIIHTASMSGRNIGHMPGPGYIASKHAVVAMSHTINVEECVNNIRSTALLPGEVNTPILAQRPTPLTETELKQMLQPDDCGDLIRYIACLPQHVTLNEVWITPTWNRGYVAALGRK